MSRRDELILDIIHSYREFEIRYNRLSCYVNGDTNGLLYGPGYWDTLAGCGERITEIADIGKDYAERLQNGEEQEEESNERA